MIIPAHLASAYKHNPFPYATSFKHADVRLQISGLNIHQDCHKDHLQDEQEPHEYVCDAIRQSNEPQGQRESCRNPQGRNASLLRVLSVSAATAISQRTFSHVVFIFTLRSDPIETRLDQTNFLSSKVNGVPWNSFFASGWRNLDPLIYSPL